MNELTLFDSDNFDRLTKATATLAKSNLVPYSLRGKQADIFSVLLMGAELGLSPMKALNSIHVINGRPCMSTALMLAMVRNKLKEFKMTVDLDEKNLVATVTAWRGDESASYTSVWDMAKAKQMGIAGRDQYIKQPMNMLKWRAVAEACRVIAPDILMGVYGIEETKDLEGQTVRWVEDEKSALDEDFPIPENEKEVGSPEYRVQNGKFRGKQLQDIELDDLKDYVEKLDKRNEKGELKQWESELHLSIVNYVMEIEK